MSLPESFEKREASDAALAMAGELARHLADGVHISDEAIRALASAATRIYSAAVGRTGVEIPLQDGDVTPTDAVVFACAILRGQGLNPFDMALWFGRVTAAEDVAGEPRRN